MTKPSFAPAWYSRCEPVHSWFVSCVQYALEWNAGTGVPLAVGFDAPAGRPAMPGIVPKYESKLRFSCMSKMKWRMGI